MDPSPLVVTRNAAHMLSESLQPLQTQTTIAHYSTSTSSSAPDSRSEPTHLAAPRMLVSAFVLLVGAAPTLAARNNIPFNIIIDHMSPIIELRSNGASNWIPRFADSPFPPSGDMVGRGASAHTVDWGLAQNRSSSWWPTLAMSLTCSEFAVLGDAKGETYTPRTYASKSGGLTIVNTTNLPLAEGELAHIRLDDASDVAFVRYSVNLTSEAGQVNLRAVRLLYSLPSDVWVLYTRGVANIRESSADIPITVIPFVANGTLNPFIKWESDWQINNRTISIGGEYGFIGCTRILMFRYRHHRSGSTVRYSGHNVWNGHLSDTPGNRVLDS